MKIWTKQKTSLFDAILDMAAMERQGESRAGSISIDNEAVSSRTHLLPSEHNGDLDHSNSLLNLARRNTMRKRSFR
jgi:hypothetical protein